MQQDLRAKYGSIEDEDAGDAIIPEMRVWRAAIAITIQDSRSRAKSAESQINKHYAINWLKGETETFRIIADYAGFDPSYLKRMMPRILEFWDSKFAEEFINGKKLSFPVRTGRARERKHGRRFQ